ncbi:acetyl/propionyl/methylcrotonyl-CoA carboxylase subunit alpha [Pseudarthrobacter sulfonivorans]|uniref:acetyl/propionyl/methylcrotonyl-CoA carboxylase subunit alpha n=1 Tax=Pseudarthrobacter sulfonivorans TaxID=121292 RepID=UPI001F0B3FEE|nr:biotin carboxylase N-terminal domain-containing protein [Pseudarthrobacter sulfonivorans]
MIANRGEIARRVIRTARTMGIRTVAVYSDIDRNAPHVTDADMAVSLGGSSATESYLDAGKILAAARSAGADAVHPGYGFLSENAEFARACVEAGLIFVGPAPDSIETMGLKDRAKDVARAAGVPVLPDAVITDDDHSSWQAAAELVGFPLLVKATAGGGGKGMRRVDGPTELIDAIDGARREASSSFGNPTVFLERLLASPRHIEIQVFGDSHGNAVHLLERECSVQRRHQKVIEEAPSPAVNSALRNRMGETAVSLVRKLGYLGAGTVEYLLDDSEAEPHFYFLEMNTRLQVEHPVTEEITGIDLVRLQLQVAAGHPLGLTQDDIKPVGHAVEVRLYAEDTRRNFLPTPGRLHRYRHASVPEIRYEDGIAPAGEVSPFYDPMLAKVIAHAPTRTEAALRLSRALAGMQIHGTTTNRDFLAAALAAPDFLAGDTHTDFIDLHPDLCFAGPATPEPVHLAAAIAVTVARRRLTDRLTRFAPPGFRMLHGHPPAHTRWSTIGGDGERDLAYKLSASSGEAELKLTIDGVNHKFTLLDLSPDGVRVRTNDLEHACSVALHADGSIWVNDSSGQRGWMPQPRLPEPLSDTALGGPASEMSGTVVAVRVKVGDKVSAGAPLVVLESMKMEHAVLAAAEGIIDAVHVKLGQYVEAAMPVVSIVSEVES